VSFENAIYQWQQGERRLQGAPPERVALLERVIDALVAELRRRLGGRFSAQELVELYPWAWEAGLVADAAFARYLREASDYAGGRRELAS
jgi:hypothetical protein